MSGDTMFPGIAGSHPTPRLAVRGLPTSGERGILEPGYRARGTTNPALFWTHITSAPTSRTWDLWFDPTRGIQLVFFSLYSPIFPFPNSLVSAFCCFFPSFLFFPGARVNLVQVTNFCLAFLVLFYTPFVGLVSGGCRQTLARGVSNIALLSLWWVGRKRSENFPCLMGT